MASVLCYCGQAFHMDGHVAICPRCCAVAAFPHVNTEQAGEMRAELDQLITEHQPKETPHP